MKKILTLAFIVLISGVAAAQSKEDKEVATVVETLRKAMVDADKKALDDVTSADLSYGHSSGKVEDKAAFIEALATGKSDFVAITLTDQTIKIVGSTAIVRHKLSGDTNDNGKTNTINLYVLLIWQKQKGQWKLLARHAARITT